MISTFRRPEYEKPVMTPEFSEMIDPVFLHVIDLLERIAQHRANSVMTERQQVRRRLDEARLKLGGRRESVLAGQALIYWIDEMLIMTDWEGQDWWNNNKLETEILDDSNDRYRFFYRDAREAAGLPDKSAVGSLLSVRGPGVPGPLPRSRVRCFDVSPGNVATPADAGRMAQAGLRRHSAYGPARDRRTA